MPLVTGETVKQVLRDLYGYEVSDADAHSIARVAGARFTLAGYFASIGITGIEPPFGYPVMLAEATRAARSKP